MKRIISLLLCTMLVLTSLIPALASENRDANIVFTDGERTFDVVEAAATDDAIYTLLRYSDYTSKAAIGRWTPATGETKILIWDKMIYHGYGYSGVEDAEDEIGINRIFTDGHVLYALDEIDMSVRRLVDGDGNVAVSEVLYSLMELMQEGTYFNGAFAQEGMLFLNLYTPEGPAVAKVDLATGELLSQSLAIDMANVYPYKDGKLLMTRYDRQNQYDPDTGEIPALALVVYDPSTGESEKIATTKSDNDGGVVYSKETDTIYFTSDSEIYALPGGASTCVLSGYMPLGGTSYSTAMLMDDDLYAVMSDGMLIVRQLDPAGITGGALSISGSATFSNEHMAVIKQNPQLNVISANSYGEILDLTDVVTKMIVGENAIDIMTLDSALEPIQRVFKKGYAADLSIYPEIMEMVSEMEPAILSPLMQDGKLYALPIDIYGSGLGYVPSVLVQLGMTEEDLPKTYLELLEFIENFQADYGDEHEDVTVLRHHVVKNYLLSELMSQYARQRLKDGEDIRFDTPLFRSLIEALERIDFAEFNPYEQYGDAARDMPAVMDSYYQKDELFVTSGDYHSPNGYDISHDRIPLLLAVEEGKEPLAGIQLRMMMINAQSERMEEAVSYVVQYMKNYNAELSFALYPDHNAPVVNGGYEDEVADITANIEKTKRSLESANAENKAEYEDTLRNLEEKLAASDNRKMLISEDEITLFREKVSPYFYVIPNWMENAEDDIYALNDRYLQKAIDADTLIRELDKRMNMMRLED